MLRVLLRLRPYLPNSLYRFLHRLLWSSIWETELRKQRAELGSTAAPSLRGSERAMLTEAIAESYPIASLLEIGCAFGQLFHTIGPLFPDVQMLGIDPEIEKIAAGNEQLQLASLPRARLQAGRAEDLSQFIDRSFDLLVTSASLLYVSPEEIERTILEAKRVGRKKLLFLEQHDEALDSPGGILGPARDNEAPYWIRNYRQLLSKFFLPEAISIQKVPNPLWRSERWEELAHLMVVNLELKV